MKLPKPTAKTLAILFCVFVAFLWITTFITALAAIFIDSSPAEGNLGGASALLAVIALILTIIAAFVADENID